MHGLAVIHRRRHRLSMVIWQRDAFVMYLPFQLQVFAAFQLAEHGDQLSQEPARRSYICIFTSFLHSWCNLEVSFLAILRAGRFAFPFLTSKVESHANRNQAVNDRSAIEILTICRLWQATLPTANSKVNSHHVLLQEPSLPWFLALLFWATAYPSCTVKWRSYPQSFAPTNSFQQTMPSAQHLLRATRWHCSSLEQPIHVKLSHRWKNLSCGQLRARAEKATAKFSKQLGNFGHIQNLTARMDAPRLDPQSTSHLDSCVASPWPGPSCKLVMPRANMQTLQLTMVLRWKQGRASCKVQLQLQVKTCLLWFQQPVCLQISTTWRLVS